MQSIEEVTIVGGGPAGAYCACELARKGVKVKIIDHSHPREKICGGGISSAAVTKFPFLEKMRPEGNDCSNFKVIFPNGDQVMLNGIQKGFNISRRILDEEIINMAMQNGAVLLKEEVTDVNQKKTLWEITTNKHVFLTKILIGADGVNSIVRRKTLGPIPKENLGVTYGYFATGAENEPTTMKFLNNIVGYIWIIPRKDHSSIGICGETIYGKRFKKILGDFVHSYYPCVSIDKEFASTFLFPSNSNFFELPSAGENWILIGDAAGHVDPITGEGILYALWSGKLAAEAIIRNEPKSCDEHRREEYCNNLSQRCENKDLFFNPLAMTLMINIILQNNLATETRFPRITSRRD